MTRKEYMDWLVERDKVKMPIPYPNLRKPHNPNAQCPVCGWVLCYRMEQFCCSCGQRFVDSRNDEFYDIRNEESVFQVKGAEITD